jgi:hypothetical protein
VVNVPPYGNFVLVYFPPRPHQSVEEVSLLEGSPLSTKGCLTALSSLFQSYGCFATIFL